MISGLSVWLWKGEKNELAKARLFCAPGGHLSLVMVQFAG